MATTTEKVASRPFHETLVELIKTSMSDAEQLARFIISTDIPHEHCAAIAMAWEKRYRGMGLNYLGVSSALKQKMSAVRTQEVTFLDVPVGRKYWNTGNPECGVLFQKTGETESVSLSGYRAGEVFTNCSPSSLCFMVIEG